MLAGSNGPELDMYRVVYPVVYNVGGEPEQLVRNILPTVRYLRRVN